MEVLLRGVLGVLLADTRALAGVALAALLRPDLARGVLEVPAAPDAFRAVEVRLEPAADFARVEREVDEAAAALRVLLDRVPVAAFAFERGFAEVLVFELDRAERRAPVDDAPELALDGSLDDHFPDITRCAASATASAMIEPNFVALETMLLAACDAVSAASRPASRIFFRAAGLALIAAAAAARPAASISLLSAALASLSTGF